MKELLAQLPLAQAGEIFGLLVTLVIIIIGALNQWMAKNAERRQREDRQSRPPGNRTPGWRTPGNRPQQRPQRPRTPEDAVEEFLRRAHAVQEEEVVPVEVVEETLESSGSSIADHVQEYFAQQQERDLVSVDTADEQMAERLQDTFDHDLGNLDPARIEAVREEQRANMADTLVGMLRSREGITSAIILHEILERPKFDD